MAHRGPDGEGIWISPNQKVGFGHRRLAIVDLTEAGAQPMSDAEGDVHITYNGEIYNFLELRRELELRGQRFKSHCDTEVLLYLYKWFGPSMLEKLEGDFAFAIHDVRENKLLLARDPAGVKPIYYARVGKSFVFASEVTALLASGIVAPDVDEESLFQYFSYMTSPRLTSMVRGVKKLAPGGALMIDVSTGSETHWRYWDPLPNLENLNGVDLDERFADLFRESVNKRRMGDVPVGVLFSGGVDSALNVVEFKRVAPGQTVRTFTVGMPGTVDDESERARRIARQLGTEHHEVLINDTEVMGAIDEIIRAQDEPVSDPVCVPLFFVTRLARQTGTIVLQAGEGADELFCGYDSYRRFLRYHERYWTPMSRAPRFVQSLGGAAAAGMLRVWPQAEKVADILDRMSTGRELFMSSAIAYYDREKPRGLARSFLERMAGHDSFDVVAPLYAKLNKEAPDATFLQKLTYIELNQRLPELLLMRVDKIGMANSIEARVPFLDKKLISFAMSVPDSFKLRDNIGKEPVKRLAAQSIARDEIYRPKTGFGAPIKQWFRGRMGEELVSLLSDKSVEADRFVNTDALRNIVRETPGTVNEAMKLWVTYSFLRWRRQAIDEAAAAQSHPLEAIPA